jgi:hypothetical protein
MPIANVEQRHMQKLRKDERAFEQFFALELFGQSVDAGCGPFIRKAGEENPILLGAAELPARASGHRSESGYAPIAIESSKGPVGRGLSS